MKNSYIALLELTQKMLSHGQQEEWDALAACENAADSEVLREIIGLNEKVLALSKANQEHYSQALLDLKRNSKKTSLYK
jgi:hypothetical protein